MRRLLSAIGIVILLALAFTLLWRVYVHHEEVHPHDEDGAIVALASRAA